MARSPRPRSREACRRRRAPRSRPRHPRAPPRRRGLGRARRSASNASAASFWAASASLTCDAELLGLARAAPASPRPGPGGSACRRSSAPPAPSRTRRWTTGGCSSAATRSSTSSVGSPRRRWAARSASGSSRRSRGSITCLSLSPDSGGPPLISPLRWVDRPAPIERVSSLSFDLRRAEPTPPGPVLLGDSPCRPSSGRSWRSASDSRSAALRPGRRVAAWGYDCSPTTPMPSTRSPPGSVPRPQQLGGRASCSWSPAYAALAPRAPSRELDRRSAASLVIGGNALDQAGVPASAPLLGRALARDRRLLVPERSCRRRRAARRPSRSC